MRIRYKDFADDEYRYLVVAYNGGLRFNAMVSQAQRVAELYLKEYIERNLMNNTKLMMSHNLRDLYDYISSMGYDISSIREPIMALNNYYTHTRYPGRDAFLAAREDIESSFLKLSVIVRFLTERIK